MKIASFKLQLWNLQKQKERELQGACESLVKISQSVFALLTFDQSSLNFTDPFGRGAWFPFNEGQSTVDVLFFYITRSKLPVKNLFCNSVYFKDYHLCISKKENNVNNKIRTSCPVILWNYVTCSMTQDFNLILKIPLSEKSKYLSCIRLYVLSGKNFWSLVNA